MSLTTHGARDDAQHASQPCPPTLHRRRHWTGARKIRAQNSHSSRTVQSMAGGGALGRMDADAFPAASGQCRSLAAKGKKCGTNPADTGLKKKKVRAKLVLKSVKPLWANFANRPAPQTCAGTFSQTSHQTGLQANQSRLRLQQLAVETSRILQGTRLNRDARV